VAGTAVVDLAAEGDSAVASAAEEDSAVVSAVGAALGAE